ncbi:hypothetical protein [Lysobacter sp. F6437]|uniref:hypothetical protein n=1 Tax=Lysobacter sp. F6437 TaxID=3459296 RepID=UPI00403DC50C
MKMGDYLANRWFKIGAVIALLGWTPLLAIILLSTIGLWPDPEPNPIGPGLLFFLTFPLALVFLLMGFIQVRAARGSRGGR